MKKERVSGKTVEEKIKRQNICRWTAADNNFPFFNCLALTRPLISFNIIDYIYIIIIQPPAPVTEAMDLLENKRTSYCEASVIKTGLVGFCSEKKGSK